MSDVTITLNGRQFSIGCDSGQEARVVELATYIDQRLQTIARSGAASNDPHLWAMTCLVLADELFDARSEAAAQAQAAPRAQKRELSATQASSAPDNEVLVKILSDLTKRIDGIAARVQAS